MEAISNIPDYEGIGIYAIIDTVNGKKYIGSSKNVKRRLMQHNTSIKSGSGNKGLCAAYNQGHKLQCKIIEKINYGVNKFYLSNKELFYIHKYDSINSGFNIHKTPSSSKEELERLLKETSKNTELSNYIIHLIKSKSAPIIDPKNNNKKHAVSKAQKKATAEYEKRKYDKVLLRLDKGEKDKIKAHADSRNESLNGFIKRAIDETMERDSGKD